MSHNKRMSESFTLPREQAPLFSGAPAVPADDSEKWIQDWLGVFARDLIDSRVVSTDAETSVEDACDMLLSEDIPCLAVKAAESAESSSASSDYTGLFDFSDVNAFLTLAATRHTRPPEALHENYRVHEIIAAARAGRVPVHLVSNLSEKNPLEILGYDASVISLLELFSRGAHRVLIRAAPPSKDFLGIVSDRRLLAWFSSYGQQTPSLQRYLSHPLHSLSLPSLDLYSSVVASTSNSTVLDAMKLMSEEGVSSIAVLDEETSALLSAVSVTDIGKIVVPSESNQILSMPLYQFISQIKESDGSTDGVDKHPVYSVMPNSALSYTIQKLLATNAHRLFVTRDSTGSLSPIISSKSIGNLSGIVSCVDILSLFAKLASIPNVDPTSMKRHRRASSASSQSPKSDRSRPNSRSSVRRSPSLRTSNSITLGGQGAGENIRNSVLSIESFQWSEPQRNAKKEG